MHEPPFPSWAGFPQLGQRSEPRYAVGHKPHVVAYLPRVCGVAGQKTSGRPPESNIDDVDGLIWRDAPKWLVRGKNGMNT